MGTYTVKCAPVGLHPIGASLDKQYQQPHSERILTCFTIPHACFSAHRERNFPSGSLLLFSQSQLRSSSCPSTTSTYSFTTPHYACRTASSSARKEAISPSELSHLQLRPASCPSTISTYSFTTPHYARQTASSSARRETISPSEPSQIQLHSSNIAATNPRRIAQLWKAVIAANMSRKNLNKNLIEDDTSTVTSLPASKRGDKTASPYDASFGEIILRPHGIDIIDGGSSGNHLPHMSFGDLPQGEEDGKKRLEIYMNTFPLEETWNTADTKRILKGYHFMQHLKYNEPEYRAYALKHFFPAEEPFSERDMAWVPIRSQEDSLVPCSNWEKPKRLADGPEVKRYLWDICPDISYGVSIRALHWKDRNEATLRLRVSPGSGICPYLSVEFKKQPDPSTYTRTANNQIATAGSMALYNRWKLKCDALQKARRVWSENDKNQLRHYGITLLAGTWRVWSIRPKEYEIWKGCIMESELSGDFEYEEGVTQLNDVINDIHYWGLKLHGQSCKEDIEELLRKPIPEASPENEVLIKQVEKLELGSKARRQTVR